MSKNKKKEKDVNIKTIWKMIRSEKGNIRLVRQPGLHASFLCVDSEKGRYAGGHPKEGRLERFLSRGGPRRSRASFQLHSYGLSV